MSGAADIALHRPVSGGTRLMGVIGDPIVQARTPAAINPIFAAMGMDVVCVPLHVPPAELGTAWAGLKALRNLIGFGVTLPHKQDAARLCDRLDPLAAALGVVNVVRREADGAFCGYQFDGRGFLRGLQVEGHDPAGRQVLLLGAGGAAVAIAHALAEAGAAQIRIENRTRDKAAALARLVNGLTGREVCQVSDGAALQDTALIVNATSLGLRPDDDLPLDPARIGAGMLVAEVIAQPQITRLLSLAAGRGAAVHSGLHMIHGQVGLIADHLAAALPRAGDPL